MDIGHGRLDVALPQHPCVHGGASARAVIETIYHLADELTKKSGR